MNTKFFHCVANGKRRRNVIEELVFQEGCISNPVQLKNEVFSFFKKHFQKQAWPRPYLNGTNLMKLSEDEVSSMEEDFLKEEVWHAITSCEGNKAPGPDGISVDFIKAHWGDIKIDFMNFLHEFIRMRRL